MQSLMVALANTTVIHFFIIIQQRARFYAVPFSFYKYMTSTWSLWKLEVYTKSPYNHMPSKQVPVILQFLKRGGSYSLRQLT